MSYPVRGSRRIRPADENDIYLRHLKMDDGSVTDTFSPSVYVSSFPSVASSEMPSSSPSVTSSEMPSGSLEPTKEPKKSQKNDDEEEVDDFVPAEDYGLN